ncbi:MAG: ABC transporter permease [Alphaproteobacteria bacterium]
MPLPLQFALRELRGGLKGFGVFLACIVLGVAAIAAVGAVREAVLDGIGEHGQVILGGDVEIRLTNQPMTEAQLGYVAGQYETSRVVSLRSMAASGSGQRTTIELKGVDDAYPLYGTMELDPAMPIQEALEERGGAWGVVVDPFVLRKTGALVGDTLRIGALDYQVRATVVREPDQAADGFTLGARAMVANASLEETGLIRLGSLIRYKYRLALPDNVNPDVITRDLLDRYADEGWRIRDRSNGAAGLRQFMERLSVFLALAGLTALVVGGVGVANATAGFLAGKRETIATFKSMGASGSLVFRTYLTQVMLLATVGVALGLILGAILPIAALAAMEDMLPVPAEPGLYLQPLILAAGYGFFTVLAFAVWPLGQARDVPAAGLFRQMLAPMRGRPRPQYIVIAVISALALGGLALAFSDSRLFTGWFLVGAVASFAILYLAGIALTKVAAIIPRPKNTVWRMALANLHRPGAATANVVLSLGLGLTLLVTIAQIESNLSAQIKDRLPDDAPAYFFVDVQPNQIDGFEDLLRNHPGVSEVTRAPMLRAAIIRVNGVRAEDAEVAPEAQWALRGDRGLSYAVEQPEGNEIIKGDWWPTDYDGPPAISFDANLAQGMGLEIGDTVTFNVMGRAIEAEIYNIRTIDWSSMGMNFSVIFAPGTLEQAPHSHLVTVRMAADQEENLEKAVAETFPNVTAVHVRDILETVNSMLGDINLAISGAASAALLAGILVLAGAMAAGYHDRVRDSVILKVLGATRGHIAKTYLVEYALMGLITALIAMVLGTLAAWLVMTQVMQAEWLWQPEVLVGTALIAMVVTVAFGFAGTWRALGEKPAPVLRTE